jgi:hypothetical protein
VIHIGHFTLLKVKDKVVPVLHYLNIMRIGERRKSIIPDPASGWR